MKRGDVIWRMKGPVLALTWKDQKAVHATGTYTQAPAENLPEVKRKQKDGTIQKISCPELVSSYSKYMDGVDKNDQMKIRTPFLCLERNGGVGFSLTWLIERSTTVLFLNKNPHVMEREARRSSELTWQNS